MPFETFVAGIEAFKADGTRAKLIRAAMSGLAERFTTEVGLRRLRDASPLAGPVHIEVRGQPAVCDEFVRLLDDVVLNHHDEFQKCFRCLEFPPSDGSTVTVPDVFKGLADVEADGVGAGESLVLVMFKNNVGWQPAFDAYDFMIDGRYWHFKDHRNADSTPMGRPKGSELLYKTPIFRFIESLGINVYVFGNSVFMDERIEHAVMKRYNCGLEISAQMFEDEIQTEFRRSACLGEAVGVLYLKQRDDSPGLYIERVDASSVCFHSNGARGFKACSVPNRFRDAILSRTRRAAAEAEHRAGVNARAAERREQVLARQQAKRELKKKAANDRKQVVLLARAAKLAIVKIDRAKKELKKLRTKRENADAFVKAYNACGTMAGAAKQLSISVSTAASRKKDAIRLGLELTKRTRDAGRIRQESV